MTSDLIDLPVSHGDTKPARPRRLQALGRHPHPVETPHWELCLKQPATV